jgi:hypothetical protein
MTVLNRLLDGATALVVVNAPPVVQQNIPPFWR